jgi:hypothetical protein
LGLELAFAEVLELPSQPETVAAPARAVSRPVGQQAVHVESHSGQGQPVTNQAPTKAAEPKPTGSGVTLETVTKAWKHITHLAKTRDASLAALLNSGKLLEIREGVLILAFASEILQEKFNRPDSLDLTKKVMREALGFDLAVQGVVQGSKNALPPHVRPDGMVAAANQLGGEIVDIT